MESLLSQTKERNKRTRSRGGIDLGMASHGNLAMTIGLVEEESGSQEGPVPQKNPELSLFQS